jgi:hypothetical protein
MSSMSPPEPPISISADTYAALQTASLHVCRGLREAARSDHDALTSEWKQELSYLDIERICSQLGATASSVWRRIVVADSAKGVDAS